MSKYSKMTLDELYDLAEEKSTPSLVKAIAGREDFSTFNTRYWRLFCQLPNTNGTPLPMDTDEVDILIIQANMPFPEMRARTGQLHYRHLQQLNHMLPDVSFDVTSLVKVLPQPFNAPNGKLVSKYTMTHMRPFIPYLLHEIAVRKPKVIVSLDTEVTKILGLAKSNGGNKGNRGEIHLSPLVDLPVVITLHPRFLNMIRQQSSGGMWGDDYYSVVHRDLQKAVALLDEGMPPSLEDAVEEVKSRIIVCRSLEEVSYWTDVMCALPRQQFTAWDLETTDLDPWGSDARILTSQVGMRIDGQILNIVIPLWHKDNTAYNADHAFRIHSRYLKRDSAKTGHNLSFDIVFLEVTTGVRLQGTIIDTLLALHSRDSGITGCYGLKTAVWDYLPWSGLGGYEGNLVWSEDSSES